jgi:hypothetical protein
MSNYLSDFGGRFIDRLFVICSEMEVSDFLDLRKVRDTVRVHINRRAASVRQLYYCGHGAKSSQGVAATEIAPCSPMAAI